MLNEEKYFEVDELLDEALKTDPEFKLSDNFADILAEKMGRRFAWEQYIREFLIYLGAIIGLLAVPFTIRLVFFGANWQEWLRLITNNISLVSGILFLVIFILFADRVLLRYFMHRSLGKLAS
ncbi:MAG: hypothetical protein Q7U86_01470 [Draconibacterium sp.]|nr:hypothetical protein [Draconibacterium sp.]